MCNSKVDTAVYYLRCSPQQKHNDGKWRSFWKRYLTRYERRAGKAVLREELAYLHEDLQDRASIIKPVASATIYDLADFRRVVAVKVVRREPGHRKHIEQRLLAMA